MGNTHMKRLIIFFCLFSVAISGQAQVDCNPYIPTEKGSTWEITNYNAKGKVIGSVSYELLDKVVSDQDVNFVIQNDTYNKKGKHLLSSTFEAKCQDGKFNLGMSMKLDGASLQQYQDMDLEIDASDFIIPSMDTPAGTTLPDATMTVGLGGESPIKFSMTINIVDREVESRQEIETPAGKFNTLVLSQRMSTKMIFKVQSSSKEWYAEGIGMVRSETYNKKGKLKSYSELTKLDKK